MTAADADDVGTTLTVRVPLQIRRRGGRKVVEVPLGLIAEHRRSESDVTVIKAIARAYRWQRMLEEGAVATMRELAAAEKISPSYISRLMQLTLIAPSIVEKMVEGRSFDKGGAGAHVSSVRWCEQIAATDQRP